MNFLMVINMQTHQTLHIRKQQWGNSYLILKL